VVGPTELATFADWDWVMNVNLGGTINGIVTILPRILAHGEGGHIVNTASMSALVPVGGTTIYSSGKAAVTSMMECMRPELEPRGVICSAFCPGAVQSNIAEAGKTRPADLAETGYAEADKRRQAGGSFMHLYQTKEEVGQRVLRGILNDELYILTHSEFLVGVRNAARRPRRRCRPTCRKTRNTRPPSPCCSATRQSPPRSNGRTRRDGRSRGREGFGQSHAHHISGRGPASRKPEETYEGFRRPHRLRHRRRQRRRHRPRAPAAQRRLQGGDCRHPPGSIDKALAALDNREVMGVQLDVASREGFREAADRVEAEMGPVSILCNNAGVNLFQPIEESSFDDWDWLLGVNLHGVINGVMTFVPRMVERVKAGEQKGGHVVNTASMAAFLAAGTPGIYNTTKFAVRGLSESLHYSLLQYGSACRCSARAW
jgi:NAD(P)-dependent dehydrogenase (short-subunit alcohol dehydrogenase family)